MAAPKERQMHKCLVDRTAFLLLLMGHFKVRDCCFRNDDCCFRNDDVDVNNWKANSFKFIMIYLLAPESQPSIFYGDIKAESLSARRLGPISWVWPCGAGGLVLGMERQWSYSSSNGRLKGAFICRLETESWKKISGYFYWFLLLWGKYIPK